MGFGQRKQTMMLTLKLAWGYSGFWQERCKVNSACSFLGIESFGTLQPGAVLVPATAAGRFALVT